MLPKLKELTQIWENFEKEREEFFDISGKAIRTTKKHQLALFKGEIEKAEELLKEIIKLRERYLNIVKNNSFLIRTDKFSIAEQEFVESYLLHYFIKENKILDFEYFFNNYQIFYTDYLAGLLDFMGELKRLFLDKLGKNKYEEAKQLKELVENIYNDLLDLNLKLANLRNKVDSLRYLIKSMEEILVYYKIKTEID
jgi:predicted translin family RNA/ssDNA-binding protein